MKTIDITFGVLTRVEYVHRGEVPDDARDAEIQEYADEIYDNLDGGEFSNDPNYWERGATTWEEVGTTRDSHGDPLLDIQNALDGVEWTPATLERIAEIMVRHGYRIRDLNDVDRDDLEG